MVYSRLKRIVERLGDPSDLDTVTLSKAEDLRWLTAAMRMAHAVEQREAEELRAQVERTNFILETSKLTPEEIYGRDHAD